MDRVPSPYPYMLGTTEFKLLQRKYRIFQKLRDVRLPLSLTSDLPKVRGQRRIRGYSSPSQRPRFDPLVDKAFQLFLENSQVTCFLIDRYNQLLHVCGDPLGLLQVPVGRVSQDILDMLPQSLQLPLSTALHQVRQSKMSIKYRGCQVSEKQAIAFPPNRQISQSINLSQTLEENGTANNESLDKESLNVTLEISLQLAHQDTGEFYLVMLTPEIVPKLTPILTEQFHLDSDTAEYVVQLERELRVTRENLQATIEELETTNEEQQATNEELIASNEELQSTNEELQSVNEELYTVNAEYQSKIQELSGLNNDLDNLLGNIDVGVIFLDQDLKIRKFTNTATAVYNLVKMDMGRPITDLSHNLVEFDVLGAIATVQSIGETVEYEVQSRLSQTYWLLRIHPYKTSETKIDGVILTFIDIDDIKQTQMQLQVAERELRQTNERLEEQVAERTASLTRFNRGLETLHLASIEQYHSLSELLHRYLIVGREVFGLDHGIVSHLEGTIYTIKAVQSSSPALVVGMTMDYHDTYCQPVIEQQETIAYQQASTVPGVRDSPVYQQLGLESYIATPIFVNQNLYGTLNFSALSPRSQDFETYDRQMIELIAKGIGHAIEINQAQTQIKASNERYELVLKGTHVGIWDLDINTGNVVISERHREMHGVGNTEDGFKTSYDGFLADVHPDDQPLLQQAVVDHLDQQRPYDIEFRLRHNQGHYIWVRDCGQAVWDDEGNPVRMVGSMEDISDRKTAEVHLQESEARFRSLYNNTPVMMHSIDNQNKLLSVSDYWLEKLGYERDEVLGRRSTEFLTEESQRYAIEVVLPKYFKAGQIIDVPYQMVTKDGRILDVLLSATSESDESGEFSRSLAVIVDVTELNYVQEALRESDVRLQFALKGTGDGIWDWNLSTNQMFLSEQWKAMLGYEDGEIANTLEAWECCIHPDDREECYRKIQRNLRQDTDIYQNEHRVRCKDGTYKWVLDRGKVIEWGDAGEPIRMIGTRTDVTQRRQQEELLRNTNEVLEAKVGERTQELAKRAAALEASNADLEQFAYIVSHDLQEPLRAMTAFSQLLKQRYTDQLDDKAQNYLNHIVEGGIRMQAMIDGILAFSRLNQNQFTVELVDTEVLLQSVLRMLGAAIAEHQATITHDSLPTIWANREQLIQVFQNLIGNGIKFRGITPPNIHIAIEEQATHWLIKIQDNGIGIPAEQKDRIFVLFQRLHTREQREGYGIGLAICKKIIDRHYGHIWFESELGQGTAFYFTISKTLENPSH